AQRCTQQHRFWPAQEPARAAVRAAHGTVRRGCRKLLQAVDGFGITVLQAAPGRSVQPGRSAEPKRRGTGPAAAQRAWVWLHSFRRERRDDGWDGNAGITESSGTVSTELV